MSVGIDEHDQRHVARMRSKHATVAARWRRVDDRRRSLPLIIVVGLVVAALCDLPVRATVWGVTPSAAISALTACLCLASLPALARVPSGRFVGLGWAWVFVTLAIAFGAVLGVGYDGAQNLTVYVVWLLMMTYAAAWLDADRATLVLTWLRRIAWLLAGLYALAVLHGGFGSVDILGARSFGLEALVLMAVAAPLGYSGSWHDKMLPLVLFVLVSLSLSRTATVAALVLLVARLSWGGRGFRVGRSAVFTGLGALVAVLAVANVPALHDRIFAGDRAYRVGQTQINTEGRTVIWSAVTSDINSSPFIGHGAGAASERVKVEVPGQVEPHNDYLRLLYDYGWIGLTAFMICYLGLVRRTWKLMRRAATTELSAAHASAFLALVAVSFGMATDNVLIYAFTMAPFGLVVGISVGLGARQDEHTSGPTARRGQATTS